MLIKRYLDISLIAAPLLILIFGIAPLAQAKEPALVMLQAPAGVKLKPTPIRDQVGIFPSPVANKPQSSWILANGDVRKSATPPRDRVVRLYYSVDRQQVLLCTLLVQYFPRNGRWIPAYRMEERLTLVRDGTRTKPLPTGMGEIDLVVATNLDLPNVNGFYKRLEFSLPSRRVTVDAWEVQ